MELSTLTRFFRDSGTFNQLRVTTEYNIRLTELVNSILDGRDTSLVLPLCGLLLNGDKTTDGVGQVARRENHVVIMVVPSGGRVSVLERRHCFMIELGCEASTADVLLQKCLTFISDVRRPSTTHLMAPGDYTEDFDSSPQAIKRVKTTERVQSPTENDMVQLSPLQTSSHLQTSFQDSPSNCLTNVSTMSSTSPVQPMTPRAVSVAARMLLSDF